MNAHRMKQSALVFAALIFLAQAGRANEAAPRLSTVIQLLQTNLSGLSDRQIEEAAISGLVRQLGPGILIETNGAPSVPESLQARTYGDFAYVRVTRVTAGLGTILAQTVKSLASTNKLKGLVLDLRFAQGDDYMASSEASNVFISQERPLLTWAGGSSKSVANPEAVTLPLAILVNRETSGAAEALGALLRDAHAGLLIGARTAGLAVIYKEFPLGDGRFLKIAGTPVELAGQGPLPPGGLSPDITLALSSAEEKPYYSNPYYAPSALSASSTNVSSPDDDEIAANHRLNEAELVRMQRQGQQPFLDTPPSPSKSPRKLNEAELVRQRKGVIAGSEPAASSVLTDPALSRALDLLKGLAVVRSKPS